MHSSPDQARLLHRTTIALTQLHRLLQQATDILANLHSLYLVHTRQVDSQFQRSFPPLPPAPSTTVPILSPTSSCDSAPIDPIRRAPPQPTASQDSSTSTPPPPPPKKKREPPPPLKEDADWDAWDGEAEVRLVELKTDARLRPNWNYVARRVGISIEQCKARWEELQDAQRKQKAATPPPPPTPTSPANTPPPLSPVHSPPSAAATPPPALPSAPDFSYTPTTPPSPPPAAAAIDDAMPTTISEDSRPEPDAADIGSYFV